MGEAVCWRASHVRPSKTSEIPCKYEKNEEGAARSVSIHENYRIVRPWLESGVFAGMILGFCHDIIDSHYV